MVNFKDLLPDIKYALKDFKTKDDEKFKIIKGFGVLPSYPRIGDHMDAVHFEWGIFIVRLMGRTTKIIYSIPLVDLVPNWKEIGREAISN